MQNFTPKALFSTLKALCYNPMKPFTKPFRKSPPWLRLWHVAQGPTPDLLSLRRVMAFSVLGGGCLVRALRSARVYSCSTGYLNFEDNIGFGELGLLGAVCFRGFQGSRSYPLLNIRPYKCYMTEDLRLLDFSGAWLQSPRLLS